MIVKYTYDTGQSKEERTLITFEIKGYTTTWKNLTIAREWLVELEEEIQKIYPLLNDLIKAEEKGEC